MFVHSPLVGPFTWRTVAQRCVSAGWSTAVVDLTPVMAGRAPYQPAIASAVAEVADPLRRPVVLVAHSGAGPLLPGVAAAVAGHVAGVVYVDAGLPYPGRSWFDAAPRDLVDLLLGMATGDWLPPWHEWSEPEVLASLLPEPRVREEFTAELNRLPLALFREPTPPATWSGPAGYLLLSEAYRGDATRAAAEGMAGLEHLSHHLAMVTDPAAVAGRLLDLVPRMRSAP